MQVILSDDHAAHFPAGELYDGALVRPFECPERWEHVVAALDAAGFNDRRAPDPVDLDGLTAVHDPVYVGFLRTCHDDWRAAGYTGDAIPSMFPVRGMRHDRVPLDIDGRLGWHAIAAETAITEGTWRAAEASAAIAQTGQRTLAGGADAAFALCRSTPSRRMRSACSCISPSFFCCTANAGCFMLSTVIRSCSISCPMTQASTSSRCRRPLRP